MKAQLIIIFAAIINFSSIATAGTSREYFYIPIGVRHFAHLMFSKSDLYSPIVNDDFIFWETGYSRKYLLNPKYLDIYEIGIHSPTNNLPSSFKFKGIIQARFFVKDELVFEKEIGNQIAASYVAGDMEHYRNVSLLNFEMPLLGKYKNDVSVTLTVLKPDMSLKNYANSVKIYIAVSGIP